MIVELAERASELRKVMTEATSRVVATRPRGMLAAMAASCSEVLPKKEVRDIFAVRGALESLAASELAAQPERDGHVAELRDTRSRMESAGTERLDDRIEADLDFHRALCRLTGNDTLVHSWTSLEGSIRMSIMYAGTDRAVGNMDVARHAVIIDAITAGDPGGARDAVVAHLNWAADNLISTAI